MKRSYFRKIISCILFIALLCITGKFLRYILNDDTASYTRITFHEMYEQDNIDVLFLGTSHCMHSFDPGLLDEMLGLNTFNGASSSQTLDGSLLILKEADKYNDIKHVYLDLFYNSAYDVHKERAQMTNIYIVSDYLKPSINKVAFLLKASGSEHYANSFIVARRNWKKLFEPTYIYELLSKKMTAGYRNYGYESVKHEKSAYKGKGYIENLPSVKGWNFFDTWGFMPASPDSFSEDYRNDLLSIIRYCREQGIELTLVSAPTSDFCLTAAGDYDEYIKWVRDIADENDIDYYDFNLCREEYFPSTSETFIDPVHLNQKGAGILAGTFAALYDKEVYPDEVFYDSYNEKIKSLPPTVFGVSFMNEYTDKNEVRRNCRITTNHPENLEYRIYKSADGSKEELIRDYSPDTLFTLDPSLHGKIMIEYKERGSSDKTSRITSLDLPDT